MGYLGNEKDKIALILFLFLILGREGTLDL